MIQKRHITILTHLSKPYQGLADTVELMLASRDLQVEWSNIFTSGVGGTVVGG